MPRADPLLLNSRGKSCAVLIDSKMCIVPKAVHLFVIFKELQFGEENRKR